MMNFRLTLMAVMASAALAASANSVSADGMPYGCGPGGCGAGGCRPCPYPSYYTFGSFAGGHCAPKPTFQAAPWYLYWPYDGHFLTPAPVTGAFFGPPTAGNFPVNPYFPGPAYGYGYGPIPGGAPPRP